MDLQLLPFWEGVSLTIQKQRGSETYHVLRRRAGAAPDRCAGEGRPDAGGLQLHGAEPSTSTALSSPPTSTRPRADLATYLDIPDDYDVIFMQGDGTGEALTALGVADEAAADQVALVAQLRDKNRQGPEARLHRHRRLVAQGIPGGAAATKTRVRQSR